MPSLPLPTYKTPNFTPLHRALTGLSTPVLTVLFAVALTTAASARPSTSSYTCSDLKDLIFQQGAIVMNTKGTSVYKRFVADVTLCLPQQITRRISVPSKSGKCRIQYCVDRIRSDNR